MPRSVQHGGAPVVVVGGGIAGLATALHLAPVPVVLIVGRALGGDCATLMAQGGIAAAIGQDDSPAQHALDTRAAAAGLGEDDVATAITAAAEDAIGWLVSQGVQFDRDGSGAPALGLEAAHSQARILHAGGDRTGREILRALVAAARSTPSIEVIDDASVEFLTQDHRGIVDGVVLRRETATSGLPAGAVVLASGGLGGLFAHTTNPLSSVGTGLALGARVGAVLRDLEFVQFHPTAIDIGRDPMPLATEALRGEGARLVDARGDDVMADVPRGPLAPRDVVAATLFARTPKGEKVFLELTDDLARALPERFPGVAALCAEAGIDVSSRRIPVRPAAHYHMGGLKVDARGRTSVAGLWACGEVASTGLHGANRLASNSLLEALVCASAIAEDLKGTPHLYAVRRVDPYGDGVTSGARPACSRQWLRQLMARQVGVVRDESGLTEVVRTLAPIVFGPTESAVELTALLVALSALGRKESRGAHRRADCPFSVDPPDSQELTFDIARRRAMEILANEDRQRRGAQR